MTDIIIAILALNLVQIWLLPMSLNTKNMAWLLSSRDEPIDTSLIHQRVERAKINLQESLPAIFALMLLALYQDVDISQLATYWLGLRIVYIPLYMYGVNQLRSLVWAGSLVCMILMAIQLV